MEKMERIFRHILKPDDKPKYDLWDDDLFYYCFVKGLISSKEGMYKEAYDNYPPKTNNDISKTARWHYVAQQVAKNTKLDMVFDMIAFNALYMGFYEK